MHSVEYPLDYFHEVPVPEGPSHHNSCSYNSQQPYPHETLSSHLNNYTQEEEDQDMKKWIKASQESSRRLKRWVKPGKAVAIAKRTGSPSGTTTTEDDLSFFSVTPPLNRGAYYDDGPSCVYAMDGMGLEVGLAPLRRQLDFDAPEEFPAVSDLTNVEEVSIHSSSSLNSILDSEPPVELGLERFPEKPTAEKPKVRRSFSFRRLFDRRRRGRKLEQQAPSESNAPFWKRKNATTLLQPTLIQPEIGGSIECQILDFPPVNGIQQLELSEYASSAEKPRNAVLAVSSTESEGAQLVIHSAANDFIPINDVVDDDYIHNFVPLGASFPHPAANQEFDLEGPDVDDGMGADSTAFDSTAALYHSSVAGSRPGTARTLLPQDETEFLGHYEDNVVGFSSLSSPSILLYQPICRLACGSGYTNDESFGDDIPFDELVTDQRRKQAISVQKNRQASSYNMESPLFLAASP